MVTEGALKETSLRLWRRQLSSKSKRILTPIYAGIQEINGKPADLMAADDLDG